MTIPDEVDIIVAGGMTTLVVNDKITKLTLLKADLPDVSSLADWRPWIGT